MPLLMLSMQLLLGEPIVLCAQQKHTLIVYVAGNYRVALSYMTYVLCALTVICFLMTLLMIRRIAVAVACIKVAASAIGSIPSLILFPLITFTATMLLFIYWVIIFAHQWSAGTVIETIL